MTVNVPATMESFVQRQLETGAFASTEDVVEAGLLLLSQKEEAWKASARAKIEEGWSQAASGQLLTPEETRASLAQEKSRRNLAQG